MEFRAGQALGKTFSIFGSNILSLLILGAIFKGPFVIPGVQEWQLQNQFVGTVANLFTTLLLQATVVYIVFQQLRGDHAGIGKALGVGFSRIFPVLGTVLLFALCIFACVLPGFIMGFATRSPILSAIAIIIPALLVFMMFYVAVPVAVVERPGVMNSLKRSQELTEGNRWGIFGIFLVTMCLGWVISYLLVRSLMNGGIGVSSYLVATGVVSIFFSLLYVVGAAVIYHDLRLEKDGVSVDELASVFE